MHEYAVDPKVRFGGVGMALAVQAVDEFSALE